MPPSLSILLDVGPYVVGKPFTARAVRPNGSVPTGTVRFGFSNPDALTYESTGKGRVRITPKLAGPLVIDATETRTGPDATGTTAIDVQAAPVVTPPVEPPPVIDPTPAPAPAPAPSTADRIFAAPRVPVAAVAKLGAAYAAYDARFPAALAAVRAQDGQWPAEVVNYYDRALLAYAMSERHGVTEWAAYGDAVAVRYHDEYLRPNNDLVQAHQAQLRGLALHALRHNDAASRDAVLRVTENAWMLMVNIWRNGWDFDLRMLARTLEAQMVAEELGGTPGPYWPDGVGNQKSGATYADRCAETVRRGLARQVLTGDEAGLWSGTGPLEGIQLNYQAAMWHEALAVYADRPGLDAAQRAAIVAAIRRGHDFLWNKHWLGAAGGFNYATKAFDFVSNGQRLTGGPGPAGDLTGMFVASFAWDARGGDAERVARRETVFTAAVAGAYLAGEKQFTEFFGTSWRAFGWR